ncbi:hypothetical protein PPH41_44285, partial [Burkholderia gladioli]|nr:hypothetical protein [Burkholderia gladioli]
MKRENGTHPPEAAISARNEADSVSDVDHLQVPRLLLGAPPGQRGHRVDPVAALAAGARPEHAVARHRPVAEEGRVAPPV